MTLINMEGNEEGRSWKLSKTTTLYETSVQMKVSGKSVQRKVDSYQSCGHSSLTKMFLRM